MKLFNDLRTAVANADVCADAADELAYAANDDETDDSAADTGETAEEAEATNA